MEINKAYTEVCEILKYFPQESVGKIPKEILEIFESEKDNYYNFIVDTEKNLENQHILDETKAILSNIFRHYWATETQKAKILMKEAYDRKKQEEIKSAMYSYNNLFKNRSSNK